MVNRQQTELRPAYDIEHHQVFELRGYHVMLAAKVAEVFEVDTRQIVQNIKNSNKKAPPLFPERYAFQTTKEEQTHLISLGVISKPGRGGSRALPWVVTRKGAIRLATLMDVPKAVEAADVFVDVFDEVLVQLYRGRNAIEISNPSRLAPDAEDVDEIRKLRKRIAKSVKDLLNTVVDSEQNTTVEDELKEVAKGAVNHVKEWLRSRHVANEKIEAETFLILEQARDIYERRQSELANAALDRERKVLENVEKKIGIVDKLLQMYDRLEPNAVIGLVGGYMEQSMGLPAPGRRNNEE